MEEILEGGNDTRKVIKEKLREHFDGKIVRKDLTKKIKVEADAELSKVFPGVQAAVVTIKTKEGEFTDRVDFPKGEPENPLTEQEFKDRYDGLMAYGHIPAEVSDRVYKAVCKNVKAEDLVKEL